MTVMTALLTLSPLAVVPAFPILAAWFGRELARIENAPYVSPSGLPNFLNMPTGQPWPAATPELGETQ